MFPERYALGNRPLSIVHVDFHRLCDLVSSASIALLVNAFQYFVDEVFLITFLSLREVDKPQQSFANAIL
jgi:hypothetical protein